MFFQADSVSAPDGTRVANDGSAVQEKSGRTSQPRGRGGKIAVPYYCPRTSPGGGMASLQHSARHKRAADRAAFELTLERGVFAGMVAGVALGLFAMVASATYQGRGFFTPMYHAAFIIDGQTMGVAIDKAGSGEPFYFARETFLFGMIIHVMVGGALGVAFALVAKKLHLHGLRALAGGLVYGLAAMALMSLVVLPQAATLFAAGKPISRMGDQIGWPTFVAQFAVFGFVLGLWLYFRPQDIGETPRTARK
jgi:uncharacterized membrane protein YagU involved in acid resistance